jgi:hypothetical protein
MHANPSSHVNVDQQPLPADLTDLISRIQALPDAQRDDLEPILNRVVEFTRRRRKILSVIQEALNQLRLDMKYLIFDLEATRRERDSYRQKLEGSDWE